MPRVRSVSLGPEELTAATRRSTRLSRNFRVDSPPILPKQESIEETILTPARRTRRSLSTQSENSIVNIIHKDLQPSRRSIRLVAKEQMKEEKIMIQSGKENEDINRPRRSTRSMSKSPITVGYVTPTKQKKQISNQIVSPSIKPGNENILAIINETEEVENKSDVLETNTNVNTKIDSKKELNDTSKSAKEKYEIDLNVSESDNMVLRISDDENLEKIKEEEIDNQKQTDLKREKENELRESSEQHYQTEIINIEGNIQFSEKEPGNVSKNMSSESLQSKNICQQIDILLTAIDTKTPEKQLSEESQKLENEETASISRRNGTETSQNTESNNEKLELDVEKHTPSKDINSKTNISSITLESLVKNKETTVIIKNDTETLEPSTEKLEIDVEKHTPSKDANSEMNIYSNTQSLIENEETPVIIQRNDSETSKSSIERLELDMKNHTPSKAANSEINVASDTQSSPENEETTVTIRRNDAELSTVKLGLDVENHIPSLDVNNTEILESSIEILESNVEKDIPSNDANSEINIVSNTQNLPENDETAVIIRRNCRETLKSCTEKLESDVENHKPSKNANSEMNISSNTLSSLENEETAVVILQNNTETLKLSDVKLESDVEKHTPSKDANSEINIPCNTQSLLENEETVVIILQNDTATSESSTVKLESDVEKNTPSKDKNSEINITSNIQSSLEKEETSVIIQRNDAETSESSMEKLELDVEKHTPSKDTNFEINLPCNDQNSPENEETIVKIRQNDTETSKLNNVKLESDIENHTPSKDAKSEINIPSNTQSAPENEETIVIIRQNHTEPAVSSTEKIESAVEKYTPSKDRNSEINIPCNAQSSSENEETVVKIQQNDTKTSELSIEKLESNVEKHTPSKDAKSVIIICSSSVECSLKTSVLSKLSKDSKEIFSQEVKTHPKYKDVSQAETEVKISPNKRVLENNILVGATSPRKILSDVETSHKFQIEPSDNIDLFEKKNIHENKSFEKPVLSKNTNSIHKQGNLFHLNNDNHSEDAKESNISVRATSLDVKEKCIILEELLEREINEEKEYNLSIVKADDKSIVPIGNQQSDVISIDDKPLKRFLDDQAVEGSDEATPSDTSNVVINHEESTDSTTDDKSCSKQTLLEDSVLKGDLLSESEDFLETQPPKQSQPRKTHKNFVKVVNSSDEERAHENWSTKAHEYSTISKLTPVIVKINQTLNEQIENEEITTNSEEDNQKNYTSKDIHDLEEIDVINIDDVFETEFVEDVKESNLRDFGQNKIKRCKSAYKTESFPEKQIKSLVINENSSSKKKLKSEDKTIKNEDITPQKTPKEISKNKSDWKEETIAEDITNKSPKFSPTAPSLKNQSGKWIEEPLSLGNQVNDIESDNGTENNTLKIELYNSVKKSRNKDNKNLSYNFLVARKNRLSPHLLTLPHQVNEAENNDNTPIKLVKKPNESPLTSIKNKKMERTTSENLFEDEILEYSTVTSEGKKRSTQTEEHLTGNKRKSSDNDINKNIFKKKLISSKNIKKSFSSEDFSNILSGNDLKNQTVPFEEKKIKKKKRSTHVEEDNLTEPRTKSAKIENSDIFINNEDISKKKLKKNSLSSKGDILTINIQQETKNNHKKLKNKSSIEENIKIAKNESTKNSPTSKLKIVQIQELNKLERNCQIEKINHKSSTMNFVVEPETKARASLSEFNDVSLKKTITKRSYVNPSQNGSTNCSNINVEVLQQLNSNTLSRNMKKKQKKLKYRSTVKLVTDSLVGQTSGTNFKEDFLYGSRVKRIDSASFLKMRRTKNFTTL